MQHIPNAYNMAQGSIVGLFNLMWIKRYLQYGFLFIYFVLRYIPLAKWSFFCRQWQAGY